jgi:hypothetical protein
LYSFLRTGHQHTQSQTLLEDESGHLRLLACVEGSRTLLTIKWDYPVDTITLTNIIDHSHVLKIQDKSLSSRCENQIIRKLDYHGLIYVRFFGACVTTVDLDARFSNLVTVIGRIASAHFLVALLINALVDRAIYLFIHVFVTPLGLR